MGVSFVLGYICLCETRAAATCAKGDGAHAPVCSALPSAASGECSRAAQRGNAMRENACFTVEGRLCRDGTGRAASMSPESEGCDERHGDSADRRRRRDEPRVPLGPARRARLRGGGRSRRARGAGTAVASAGARRRDPRRHHARARRRRDAATLSRGRRQGAGRDVLGARRGGHRSARDARRRQRLHYQAVQRRGAARDPRARVGRTAGDDGGQAVGGAGAARRDGARLEPGDAARGRAHRSHRRCRRAGLITGESGVGKDVVAREIHARSARVGAPVACS